MICQGSGNYRIHEGPSQGDTIINSQTRIPNPVSTVVSAVINAGRVWKCHVDFRQTSRSYFPCICPSKQTEMSVNSVKHCLSMQASSTGIRASRSWVHSFLLVIIRLASVACIKNARSVGIQLLDLCQLLELSLQIIFKVIKCLKYRQIVSFTGEASSLHGTWGSSHTWLGGMFLIFSMLYINLDFSICGHFRTSRSLPSRKSAVSYCMEIMTIMCRFQNS